MDNETPLRPLSSAGQAAGNLYIVATPIGNMGDITLRALEIFKEVSLVACEDTRVTGSLLYKLEIKKPLKALHQHSLDSAIDDIIAILKSGQSVAYVTDGGTPGISDPGQRLVSKVRSCDSEIKVIPVPGASALTAAISVSGMIEKGFYFAGFLPKKKGRQTELKHLATINAPVIIYESALRVEKTMIDLMEHFGPDTSVFIAREMTKMFEEYWGGSLLEVSQGLKEHKLKGELVLIIKK